MKIKGYNKELGEVEVFSSVAADGYFRKESYQSLEWRVPRRALIFHYIVFELEIIPDFEKMFLFLDKVEKEVDALDNYYDNYLN